MTMDPSRQTFADLIAPLPMDEFFERHWEKTFLHIRQKPDAFAGYFSLAEVDHWLRAGTGLLYLTPPTGERPETQTYRPADISLSLAYSAFRRGCLLVLEPFKHWPAIQGLIGSLGRDFYAEISASAFVAPPGARAFPPFAAGHDTLVLQLEGESTWNLHEFWLLQRNPVEKKNLKFPLEWYGRPKTPVIAELRLQPGHVLYIPRGMPYQVQQRDVYSLHLQVDIQPLGWMDLFKIAIDCASVHSQELRRSVPLGFLTDAERRESLRAVYEELIRALPQWTSFDEVIAAVQRNRVKAQGFPADGHFGELLHVEEITVDSLVEHRQDILCFAEPVTDIDKKTRSALFFGQELVAGPELLLEASLFVRDHRRFRVSEIPGLDGKSQVVLVRRLMVEGLLRRAPPGAEAEDLLSS